MKISNKGIKKETKTVTDAENKAAVREKSLTVEDSAEIHEIRRRIRRGALKARDALSSDERRRGSLLMTERILGHQWFYSSDIFLCFVSFGSEIDTNELLREAIRLGKKVYVPKVITSSQKNDMTFYKDDMHFYRSDMHFYRVTALSELSEGYKGIFEPTGMSEKYEYRAENASRTLLLMPGAAFDGFRNRLGYGKGFYDAFLADKEALQLRTIAVGFQCQMVEKIPEREGDIKPCQVICL